MKKVIMQRLLNRSGESLIETITAVLIAALAILMLANSVASSRRVITQSEETMTGYYDNNNRLSQHDNPDTEGRVCIKEGNGSVKLTPVWNESGESICCYVNDELGKTVLSYSLK